MYAAGHSRSWLSRACSTGIELSPSVMSIRQQIRPMLTLALPLILAEVGWMSMGIVDTVMVGHMAKPALAISAAALGQVLYNTIAFGIAGILLGLDTYLAQSHGAGRFDEANRWLLHGLILAAGLALALILIIVCAPAVMLRLPIERDILTGSIDSLGALNWGTPRGTGCPSFGTHGAQFPSPPSE